ncbi:MAG: flagellar assembly factor FliW [Isosphaeraceae bacterium]|nr:MAG: flagellar assembly factor FliW [Isosphaeraceae bacterium]
MNIVTTRFGTIRVAESELIRLIEGPIGFRSQTLFVLMPDPETPGLKWLQSATMPELAFGLVSPAVAVPDYRVELRPADLAALELDDERDAQVYLILNRAEPGGLTVNLQGPLVVNPVRRLARQMVMTSSRYAIRYPLVGTLPGPAYATSSMLRVSA